jgi:hypothetical protein
MESAWPEVVTAKHRRAFDPALHGFSCLFSDLELDGPLGLALHDRSTFFHMARHQDISHLEPHEITASELAVDGHIEEGKVANVIGDLKAHADRPDVLWQKRTFLTNDPAFIPGRSLRSNDRKVNCGHGFSSIPLTRPTPTLR